MRLKNVKFYIFKLIKDGQFWQNIDLNGKEKKPKFFFSSIQLTFIAISIVWGIYSNNGVNNDFIGYSIAALSIFIGLFLTLLLSVFDKFKGIDFSKANKNDDVKIDLIRMKNFFKQFTALTSYSILLSILSILLLILFYLIPGLDINLLDYTFVDSINKISVDNGVLFIRNTIILIHRIAVAYFLLDFLLIVIYAVTSFYSYIYNEYEQIKIDKS